MVGSNTLMVGSNTLMVGSNTLMVGSNDKKIYSIFGMTKKYTLIIYGDNCILKVNNNNNNNNTMSCSKKSEVKVVR